MLVKMHYVHDLQLKKVTILVNSHNATLSHFFSVDIGRSTTKSPNLYYISSSKELVYHELITTLK